jgi:transcriptional regulator with XRE-family HTH domain
MKTTKSSKLLSSVLIQIGEKLGELRKKKGYETIKEFALDYKLPLIQYWRIENGKTNLTIKSLLSLLAIHRISIDEFF